MPRNKTITLNKSAMTNARRDARIDAELSFRPLQELSELPARLKNHAIATAEWKRAMGLYSETSAEMVTAFDETLLIRYCLLIEQLDELDKLRAAAYKLYSELEKKQTAFAKRKKKIDDDLLAGSIGYITDAVVKLDARVDRKSALLLQYSQSLYLTPKARAGVAPPKKPAPVSRDEMDEILGTLE